MGSVESSPKSRTKSLDKTMNTPYFRRAHHAGSWYSSDRVELDNMLSKFLEDAETNLIPSCDDTNEKGKTSDSLPRACICPHAGFQYSGPTAAYSYLALEEALTKNSSLRTIVVLHPSHHVYLDGCAVSGASVLETPLGNLPVDEELREQLLSTGKFTLMERTVDEEEHSGEMQYPFIAKILNDAGKINKQEKNYFTINVLPIMVGSVKPKREEAFGKLISSHLSDPGIFTIISSDFCHWGKRFGYTPLPPPNSGVSVNEVHEYIQYLDRKGMDLIEMQRPGAFADYLREHSNTICGRHPIGVWLHSIALNTEEGKECLDVRFVKYAQSGEAKSTQDFSVSYASAVARLLARDWKQPKKQCCETPGR